MFITTMAYPTTYQEGRSALSLAAGKGHVDVMKVLLKGGADVNIQNKVIMYITLQLQRFLVYWGYNSCFNLL